MRQTFSFAELRLFMEAIDGQEVELPVRLRGEVWFAAILLAFLTRYIDPLPSGRSHLDEVVRVCDVSRGGLLDALERRPLDVWREETEAQLPQEWVQRLPPAGPVH
jgi:hypothetical protein